MPNFTKVCNCTKIEDALSWTADLDHRGILSLVTNIPLSIFCIFGECSYHCGSKKGFLLSSTIESSPRWPCVCVCVCVCVRACVCVCVCVCACSDLCIGLITQPLHVTYKLCKWFSEHSNHCVHLLDASIFTSTLFVGASLLTITEINVDRLLALMMGPRYRQVVTLRRVQFSIASSWLLNGGEKNHFFPFSVLCVTSTAMLLCLIILTCC